MKRGGIDLDRPVTPATLRQAVGERDYQRRRDPDLFAGVAAGFRSLFPGDVRRDATGRMKPSTPRAGVTFRNVLGELGLGSLDAAHRAGRRKAAAKGRLSGGNGGTDTLAGQGADDAFLRNIEPQRRPVPRFPDEAVGDGNSQRRGVPLWGPWYGGDAFIPEEKKAFFERPENAGAMDNFRDALAQKLPDASLVESLAHQLAYGWEGGEVAANVGTEREVLSGVTPTTIERLVDELGMDFAEANDRPADLTLSQRVQAYRGHLDDVLARPAASFSEGEREDVAGHEVLDRVGDAFAAIALSDTLFRHGRGEGTRVVQRAINRVVKQADLPPARAVQVDGGMGPQTFDAYTKMSQDPATRDLLLDQVASERKLVKRARGDIERAEFFRFAEWR